MRMLIAAALLCAVFAAPASALPLAQAGLSAPAAVVQVKSKGKGKPASAARAAKAKGGKCAPGAICPLVGSGDY